MTMENKKLYGFRCSTTKDEIEDTCEGCIYLDGLICTRKVAGRFYGKDSYNNRPHHFTCKLHLRFQEHPMVSFG